MDQDEDNHDWTDKHCSGCSCLSCNVHFACASSIQLEVSMCRILTSSICIERQVKAGEVGAAVNVVELAE